MGGQLGVQLAVPSNADVQTSTCKYNSMLLLKEDYKMELCDAVRVSGPCPLDFHTNAAAEIDWITNTITDYCNLRLL